MTSEGFSTINILQTMGCHFEVAVRLRNWPVGAGTEGACPCDFMFLFVVSLFSFVPFVVKKQGSGFRVQGQKQFTVDG
jgi:hypothetical protein